ncbi:hypothetical protein CRUP_013026 [Coryphaenoides rupestris]|nr:hypothetical protein CRUP_013026 [Coryphaenoides rupestris]
MTGAVVRHDMTRSGRRTCDKGGELATPPSRRVPEVWPGFCPLPPLPYPPVRRPGLGPVRPPTPPQTRGSNTDIIRVADEGRSSREKEVVPVRFETQNFNTASGKTIKAPVG